MSSQKNDKQQLRGILKEFDLGQAKAVLSELISDSMPKSSDFKNQGELCTDGHDGCVGREEFERDQEAVWGQTNFLSAHFLTEGAEIQKAIAMVTLKVAKSGLPAGNGWGSGFLISNSLFMTNNHVIPNKEFCDDVNMQFMFQDNYDSEPAISSEFFETDEDSFFHTDSGLDYTIVRLRRKPQYFIRASYPRKAIADSSIKVASDLTYYSYPAIEEQTESEQIEAMNYINGFVSRSQPLSIYDYWGLTRFIGYTPGSKYGFIPLRPAVTYPIGLRLNVIQHPQGRKKELVVQQNELRDVHTNVIHYFSDTDYGSSGSPVFNNTWDLMALHHARTISESANEGIRVDKIVADLRNEFQTSNPGILTELGI